LYSETAQPGEQNVLLITDSHTVKKKDPKTLVFKKHTVYLFLIKTGPKPGFIDEFYS